MPIDAYGNPLPAVPLDDIESIWGNAARDRLQLTWPNAAARDAAIPTPHAGARVWLDDPGGFYTYTGSGWLPDVATVDMALDFYNNPADYTSLPAGNPGAWTAIRTGVTPWTMPTHWNSYRIAAQWFVAAGSVGAAFAEGRMQVDGDGFSTVLQPATGDGGPLLLVVLMQKADWSATTPAFDLELRTTASAGGASAGYRDARLELTFYRNT